MKIKILSISVFVILIFSCTPKYFPPHGKSPLIENYFGVVTEKDVAEGIKLKKKYPENTEYVADYIVSSYKFDYYADNVKKGNPIGVKEETFEKYTTTTDFVKFKKLEYFDDQTTFDGYYLRLGSKSSASFNKQDYVITNFQSGGIFYSDAKQAQIGVDMSVLGTNLRINYSKYYKDAKYLTSAYFLEGFPQKEKVITFAIPNYLTVEIIEKNFSGYNIEKTDKKYVIKDDAIKSRLSTEKSNEKVTYVTYILKDTKAIDREGNMPGYSHNLPHIVILVKSINYDIAKAFSKAAPKEPKTETKAEDKSKAKGKTKAIVKKEEKKPVPLIANTNDLYAHYSQIVSTVENDSSVFMDKLKTIIAGKNTDLEKIESVFYWVQDNIRYVAFEDGIAGFKPDACQNVFNNRFGDCKGMANLLKNMLTSLGYDARLTWIGTKHLNYDYSIPSIMVDNHMICTVILNGKKYYLDGTESFIGIDDYADRIQGRQVMVQNGANYFIDTIPDLPTERNLHLRKATLLLNESSIDGKMYETIKGENKTEILRAFHNAPLHKKDKVLDNIVDPDDIDIDASNIQSTDLSNRNVDININYDVMINNHLFTVGNTMMLKPDFNREFSASKADTGRFFDMQFDHKINYAYDITYQIPTGYKVTAAPQDLIIDNPEFSLLMKYENYGNAIRYTKSIVLKKGKISKSNFKQWNEMIDKLRYNYNQYIVLNK
jgi:hypothetical protein